MFATAEPAGNDGGTEDRQLTRVIELQPYAAVQTHGIRVVRRRFTRTF